MAEREGFEPPVPFRVRRFSSSTLGSVPFRKFFTLLYFSIAYQKHDLRQSEWIWRNLNMELLQFYYSRNRIAHVQVNLNRCCPNQNSRSSPLVLNARITSSLPKLHSFWSHRRRVVPPVLLIRRVHLHNCHLQVVYSGQPHGGLRGGDKDWNDLLRTRLCQRSHSWIRSLNGKWASDCPYQAQGRKCDHSRYTWLIGVSLQQSQSLWVIRTRVDLQEPVPTPEFHSRVEQPHRGRDRSTAPQHTWQILKPLSRARDEARYGHSAGGTRLLTLMLLRFPVNAG